MKIFLDFDNTLLHTRALTNTLYKPYLESQGVARENIEKTFSTFANGVDPSRPAFSIEEHLTLLEINEEKQKEYLPKLKAFFQDAKDFLFPDVETFLKNLSEHEVVLLTFGNHDFQDLKVQASGVEEYCKEICITGGSKADEIAKRIDENESFILIDDHGEYFEPLKKRFGNRFHGIHFLHSDTQRTCDQCGADMHPKNFEEVIHSIQNICAA